MKDYVIVTDTTADLPLEIYQKLNIKVIPMDFILDGKTYRHYEDAREMSFSDFYANIRQGKDASTTQINYYTYEKIFKEILEAGKDILYLAFTSGMSGTFQSANLVVQDLKEKYPNRKILIVDTFSASIGEGVLVLNVAKKSEEGLNLEELFEWAKENSKKACHWFVVDNFEQLKRGGRINLLQATIGTALNLKPLLSVDDNGKLVSVTKLRGSKKIIDSFISHLKSDGVNLKDQTIIVGHANNIEFAQKIVEKIKEEDLVKDIIISDIGPIIGTHVGEGMVAVAFMGNRNLK